MTEELAMTWDHPLEIDRNLAVLAFDKLLSGGRSAEFARGEIRRMMSNLVCQSTRKDEAFRAAQGRAFAKSTLHNWKNSGQKRAHFYPSVISEAIFRLTFEDSSVD